MVFCFENKSTIVNRSNKTGIYFGFPSTPILNWFPIWLNESDNNLSLSLHKTYCVEFSSNEKVKFGNRKNENKNLNLLKTGKNYIKKVLIKKSTPSS